MLAEPDDMVTISQAAELLAVNKSTISRYVVSHASALGVTGEGRDKRVSLSKLRAHRSNNLATPLTIKSLPERRAHAPEDRQSDTGGLANIEKIKLERAQLSLARERREDEIARGALVPVEEFEGLGQMVGARLSDKLMQLVPRIVDDVMTADAKREAIQAVSGHIRGVLEEVAQIFEAQAVSRKVKN